MIVVDTSAILAYMNSVDIHHAAVAGWLDEEVDDLITTPLIVAEADHLVGARGGRPARDALWSDLEVGAYLVEWWPSAARESVAIARGYADRDLGLADASLVALAERVGTASIATLDERHFRTVAPVSGAQRFRLLPQDA